MPREKEKVVVGLVARVLQAEFAETPHFLIRPGEAECGRMWEMVKDIYRMLSGSALPCRMSEREWRKVDAVLKYKENRIILEFDEIQHFNSYRSDALSIYKDVVPLSFPTQRWMSECLRKNKLEAGGFGKPRPPLFPGENGRHKQRAFRDALCDLLPMVYGFQPTLRIGYFEVESWLYDKDAERRLAELIEERLAR